MSQRDSLYIEFTFYRLAFVIIVTDKNNETFRSEKPGINDFQPIFLSESTLANIYAFSLSPKASASLLLPPFRLVVSTSV